ncbi:MAG: type II toxin-antitoxin system PemK/MazF family toxin [Euzebyales bacterium]|nr:type II toxin-antitoxin system PemK/MazF family toxin [Euzebyales bacterium]
MATVVCVTVTRNLRLAEAPGNVLLAPNGSGLADESVANVSQIVTLNKRDLKERHGAVAPATFQMVESGIRLVLGLDA